MAPSESFSSVVRRAVFPKEAMTGRELVGMLRRWMQDGRALVDQAILDRLDAAQRTPRISASEW